MKAAAFVLGLLAVADCPAQQPAFNNPQASFDGSSFNLPELKNPEDAYTIVIKVAGSADPKLISLPPGVNGIRMARAALPKEAWTWDFKLVSNEPAPLALLTPDKTDIGKNDLRNGRYPVRWKAVESAAAYRVHSQTRPHGAGEDWAPEDSTDCPSEYCVVKGTGFHNLPMSQGSDTRWWVSALDPLGLEMARSTKREVAMEPGWLTKLQKAGFSLQRSDALSEQGAALPASFGYARSQTEGEEKMRAYQAEFALLWSAPEGRFLDSTPTASFEARLTSRGKDKEDDARLWRLGLRRFLNFETGSGMEVVANFKHESARKDGTRKGMLELNAVPVIGFLARNLPIGAAQRDVDGNYIRLPWATFTPILQFGIDAGKTFDRGSSEEVKRDLLRYRANARLDLELNSVARAISANNVLLYADLSFWKLPKEEREFYRLGKAGLSIGLTEELSFDLSHDVGRRPPEFKFIRETKAGFGLKF